MNEVQVKDKVFRPFISAEKVQEVVAEIAGLINTDYRDKNPVMIGVLNGSFIFMADLVRELNCGPGMGFIGISSYGDEMKSSGTTRITMPLNAEVKDKHVLIVEDIVDAGNTTEWLRGYLAEQGAASVKVVTLLHKPAAFKGKTQPEYCGMQISNEFVVGYGLDYAGLGRELKGIYQLKS